MVSVADPLFVLIVEMRALNLMWGLRRQADALAVNRAARAISVEPADADELTLWEATLLTYSGHPADALAVLEPFGTLDRPCAGALYAIAEVLACARRRARNRGPRGRWAAFAEHVQMPLQMAIAAAGIHVINEIYALIECGRPRDAVALATAAIESLPPNVPPAGSTWLTHLLGRALLLLGHAATRAALARRSRRALQ